MDILIFPFVISSYFLILGNFIKKILFKNLNSDRAIEYIISLIFLSNLFLILNFFISLNKYINTLVFILPLIYIFFLNRKLIIEILFISLIFSLFFVMLVSFDNVNRPDVGLYHLPFISILNENKIILGLGNLHFRFGHTSILQYLEAGFNNIIFKEMGILIPKTIFFFSISYYFLREFFYNINTKKSFLTILTFLIIFQIFYDMNRYSYHGNDVPAHLIIYFISYFYIKNNEFNFDNFFFISLLCLFSFQIKSTSLVLLILPLLIVILNKNLFKFCLNKKNLIIIFFLLLWVVKNILISGCLIFPIKQTCFKNIYWNSSLLRSVNDVYKVSEENEAWAKGWPDRKDTSLNYKEFLKSDWTKVWLSTHGKKVILKKILPLIILILLFILLTRTERNKAKIDFRYIKKNFIIFSVLFLGSILWFIKFPTYRYGSSYVVGSLIFLQFYLYRNFLLGDYLKKILKIFIIFLLVVVSIKYFLKYDNSKHIWPNIYSFTEETQKPYKFKKIYKDDKFLYYQTFDNLCMYSPSPCTNIPVHKSVNLKEYFGYKIYFLDIK